MTVTQQQFDRTQAALAQKHGEMDWSLPSGYDHNEDDYQFHARQMARILGLDDVPVLSISRKVAEKCCAMYEAGALYRTAGLRAEWIGEKLAYTVSVPSGTNSGRQYENTLYPDGTQHCSCPHGAYDQTNRRVCCHDALHLIAKGLLSPEEIKSIASPGWRDAA